MLIYACNRQSARYEQSTSPASLSPLPPLQQASTACPSRTCMETKLFGATNFAWLPSESKRIEWVLKGTTRWGEKGEGAEVCEKLVSEVNKSICHNQFRCKIPSLLGQISLFLFQREGEQKKKTVERQRKFLQFDYEICLKELYGNDVSECERDKLKIE